MAWSSVRPAALALEKRGVLTLVIVRRVGEGHEDSRRFAADQLRQGAGARARNHQVGGGKEFGHLVAKRREDRAQRLAGLGAQLARLRLALAQPGHAVDLDALGREQRHVARAQSFRTAAPWLPPRMASTFWSGARPRSARASAWGMRAISRRTGSPTWRVAAAPTPRSRSPSGR